MLGWLYLVGVLFLLGRLLWRLGSLAHYIRSFKKTPKPGYCLVQTEGLLPTFSFLHYLFWDNTQALTLEEENKILHHELAHIHGHHSLDMFYAELLTVFFWFHPAAYAYKQALRNTHEFIADAAALRFCDRQSYQKLMVQRLFHQLHLRVIHNFNQNEIQKRLHQIQKRPTPAYWQLKMLLLLPVLGLTLMSLAGRLPESIPALAPVLSEEEQNRFATAEGGLDNFYREVIQKISYPASARRAGIEGRVYIQFSVMPDGSRQDFRVVKGIDPACDAAALEAVRQAKTPWLPAKVGGQNVRQTVSIPITFQLN
ncbi:MAG: TonB family protein [Microscillaceae bacterium]|nr:TonB family protein [Microscillaceae bacterium]